MRTAHPHARARSGRLASPWPAVLLLLLAAGCTVVGRDHVPPKAAEAGVPPEWREEPGRGLAAGEPDLAAWWSRLGDPVLDRLVERAVSGGLDLQGAIARVREARSLRAAAAGGYYPTIDAVASSEHLRESENTPFGEFAPETNIHTLGFDASWEIDLWGRVRRSVEAADADLGAEIEDARAVAVTVAAETAFAYVELRAFQRRIEIANTNVSLQEQTLALVRSRFDAGLVGERDVAQAQTIVETTRSQIPELEVGRRAAENRLAVLLGLAPGALAAELGEPRPIPSPPVEVAVGVPADLLRRRPDIRRAERLLASEVARIGVAEGELYPRLTLFGTLGISADGSADLFDAESRFASFGPSLRWNIFDGGRIRALVDAQDARAEQARIAWQSAVLGALEEAENAMTAFLREQARRGSLGEAAGHARLAVDLAQTQYTEGISDYQVVLISQRALAELEDDLAQSDARITASLVALYKALGGGFEHDPIAAALEVAERE